MLDDMLGSEHIVIHPRLVLPPQPYPHPVPLSYPLEGHHHHHSHGHGDAQGGGEDEEDDDDDDLYEDSVVAANADTIFHPMGSNANPNPTSNNSSAGNLLSLPRNVSANSLKIANFDR